MHQRNEYDQRGALELGEQAESRFETAAARMGFKVIDARPNQDMYEHWDYLIIKAGKQHRVEVKSMKRVDSMDPYEQSEWIWIELHGVRENDEGWLYGGKADLIAFEQSDHFIVVRRPALKNLVERLVINKEVTRSSQAEYAIYSRPGRSDKITMIRARDLFKIRYKIWRML